MRLTVKLVALAAMFAIGLGACSDDEVDVQALIDEYCELSKTLDEQDGPPTEEQITEIVEAAPPDIEEPAQTFQEAFEDADGNIGKAFSDPDAEAAIEDIEAWEADNCPHAKNRDKEEEEDGPPAGDVAPTSGANIVEVTGTEYAFAGIPETLPPGLTALGFTNEGEEQHEMVIAKLESAATVEEALAHEGDPYEDGLVSEVGVVVKSPGDPVGYVNTELEAGTYAVLCFIPGPENKPHYEHGMIAQFTVEAA